MSNFPLKLQGKVAIITGAGSGIGAATAKLFTQLGGTIAITGTTKSKLDDTVAECQKVSVGQPQPLVIVGDIRESEVRQKIIDETLKAFGKLDILVNNAGMTIKGTLLEGSIANYDKIFDVNLRSVIALTQLAAPHLMKTKGSIVNISSVAAQKVIPTSMFYSMSKIALNQFTKFAAQELGPHQVRVNIVSPGLTRTLFAMNHGMKKEEVSKYYDNLNNFQVLGRAGEASEIASTIAYLASDEASFVTGADFVVDGGHVVTSGAPVPSFSTNKN